MAIRLSSRNLGTIGARVPVPNYDRSALKAGIVHFGVGNFHRAHQASYLDALFNTGHDHDWAIIGAGVMPSDESMRAALAHQDYLTTVVEQEADANRARVIGSMIDFLPTDDATSIISALADPAIRIVSMTVTEGGYFINSASGHFDSTHPLIVADARVPVHPRTVFGLIVAGLARRKLAGIAPFTVMSCDNVPHNGAVARNAVTGLARLSDPAFADWIAENVAFPNSMVDRITPATSDRERVSVARDYGIGDTQPVFCEAFTQWVLEDHFPSGRPALETVGVQFVPDVTPYEDMKIRILNGGHAVISYPAGLLGVHFVHEAMAHPLIRGFLDKVEREEILPVVPPVPDTDLREYLEVIERRFSNPKIGDTVRRLCLDGSNRQPKFIIPSIADRLRAGLSVPGLALSSALWCRYCYGTTDSGAEIAPNDPDWSRLSSIAKEARGNPSAWLEMEDIYGAVGQSPKFREAFGTALTALWSKGVERTLSESLNA